MSTTFDLYIPVRRKSSRNEGIVVGTTDDGLTVMTRSGRKMSWPLDGVDVIDTISDADLLAQVKEYVATSLLEARRLQHRTERLADEAKRKVTTVQTVAQRYGDRNGHRERVDQMLRKTGFVLPMQRSVEIFVPIVGKVETPQGLRSRLQGGVSTWVRFSGPGEGQEHPCFCRLVPTDLDSPEARAAGISHAGGSLAFDTGGFNAAVDRWLRSQYNVFDVRVGTPQGVWCTERAGARDHACDNYATRVTRMQEISEATPWPAPETWRHSRREG